VTDVQYQIMLYTTTCVHEEPFEEVGHLAEQTSV